MTAVARNPLTTRAPAKVNLNLVVHGRRADGYHDLSSLVMFAGVGDELALDPSRPPGLSITGPFASGLVFDQSNLVLKASASLLRHRPGLHTGHFTLTKRLPIGSGVGGGSADAAATLRLLARLNGLAPHDPLLTDIAVATGADVAVCLRSRACMMHGIGERLGPPLILPRLFAVLANPGIHVSTAEVFQELGLKKNEMRLSADAAPSAPDQKAGQNDQRQAPEDFIAALGAGHGNDLEAPARRVAPAISVALQALAETEGCNLARMSGSGATCFGLFSTCVESANAARQIKMRHPTWWVKPTVLR